MIQYKRCSDVNIDLVYEAFKVGFSDYIIKMEVSKGDFIQRFLGPEGNLLEHSFLCFRRRQTCWRNTRWYKGL